MGRNNQGPIAVDQFTRIHGTRIRYRTLGSGPPLLLMHGMGASLELWDPVLPFLEGFTVVLMDHPGAGLSATSTRPMTMRCYARVAHGLLGHLQLRDVAVLGLSFGGMVAQELARAAPQRVSRLVLVCTSCGWGSVPGGLAALAAVATPLRYHSPAYMKMVAPILYGGGTDRAAQVQAAQAEARLAYPPSTLGYFAQLTAAWTWSSRPYLRRLCVPTLVVSGSDDPVIPAANGRILAGLIGGAQYFEVDGGGHLCLLDAAERVAPRITAFLRNHARGD